jgi:hypothetical protein
MHLITLIFWRNPEAFLLLFMQTGLPGAFVYLKELISSATNNHKTGNLSKSWLL